MSQSTLRHIKADMEKLLPNLKVETFFDVGANVGQTVLGMRALQPDAHIYAFEPIRASYDQLTETAGQLEKVECFNLALSESSSSVNMLAKGTSSNNRVVSRSGGDTEEVRTVTGDSFCEERGIDHIDYLKIDTEGHELQVLQGFRNMTSEFRIDMIELEAGMNWQNEKHTPFERLKGYLEPSGYLVFRLYEQIAEKRGKPQLRRVNVVFISETTIERNIRPSKKRVKAGSSG